MLSLETFETAFAQALAAVSGIPPIAEPNRTASPVRPFVLFDHVPTVWENVAVDASETRAAGYIMVSVCIADNVFAKPANAIADDIMAAFPVGRRLAGVCVTNVAPMKGYHDGVGWRQPVRIDYASEA